MTGKTKSGIAWRVNYLNTRLCMVYVMMQQTDCIKSVWLSKCHTDWWYTCQCNFILYFRYSNELHVCPLITFCDITVISPTCFGLHRASSGRRLIQRNIFLIWNVIVDVRSFHWHVQNVMIPCRSQELLPFLSVMYFFLPPFSTNYSSILSHPILPSISWSTSQSHCSQIHI